MSKTYKVIAYPTEATCPTCTGDGTVEYEVNRPQGFSRDVGCIDVVSETCPQCNGDGFIEIMDADLDEIDF